MRAEDKVRYWIEKCADCDVCRTLMDPDCSMFNQLYCLWDREQETGEKITTHELRRLADSCNLCGICPCDDLPTALLEAKTGFAAALGLPLRIKAIERVGLVGRVGNAVPGISNFLLQNPVTRGFLQSVLGIHRDRRFPPFSRENFSEWMGNRNSTQKPQEEAKRRVAYFVGCSARYYVPEVGRAVVQVLERNGIEVHIPEQECCGMPPLLEGDRDLALKLAGFNLDRLAESVEAGYDIVCSCPTCGFALKNLLQQGAQYSTEYKAVTGSSADDWQELLSVPPEQRDDLWMARYGRQYIVRPLKDWGYFSSLSPLKRIMVAEHTYDLGEYLRNLHRAGELDVNFGTIPVRSTYYPPCHLREQEIGSPYAELLSMIPGLHVDCVQGLFYCCGAAGIACFKREFHENSLKTANKLIERIKELRPERLLTDCLGCRYQFNHLTPYEVSHPIEIMKQAYDGSR